MVSSIDIIIKKRNMLAVKKYRDENKDKIRVLWVGLKPEENILELQRLVDSTLLDLVKSDGIFNAHLTIGRVKVIKDMKVFLEKLSRIKIEKLNMEVDKFYLLNSKLTKDGPSYSDVKDYALI